MASSEIKKDIRINLTLSAREALWLKGMVQNPHYENPMDEPLDVQEIRKSFWDALPSFEELSAYTR